MNCTGTEQQLLRTIRLAAHGEPWWGGYWSHTGKQQRISGRTHQFRKQQATHVDSAPIFASIFQNYFSKTCVIRWEDWELEYVSELWQICKNSLPLVGGGGRWSMFQSFDKVQNTSPNFSGSNSRERESSCSNVISSVAIKSNASWCIKDWDSIKTFCPVQQFGTEKIASKMRVCTRRKEQLLPWIGAEVSPAQVRADQ